MANISAAESLSVTAITRMGGGLAGASIEFVLMADEIQRSKTRMDGIMKKIDLGNKLRDAIALQLDYLRKIKAEASMHLNEKNKLPKQGTKEWEALGKSLPEEVVTWGNKNHAPWEGRKHDVAVPTANLNVDSVNETVLRKETTATGDEALIQPGKALDKLDFEIKRLEDQISRLDSDREITMLRLNEELNTKNRIITQVTNFIKAENDAAMTILSNLRTR